LHAPTNSNAEAIHTLPGSCRRVPRFPGQRDAAPPHLRHDRDVRAILLCVLTACATTHAFDDQPLRAVLTAQQEAWNRGDLDAFMAGYLHSQELVFTSGGHIRHGYDDTIAKYRAKYGNDRSTMGHLAFEILQVQPLGSDGAIMLGRWKLTDTPNAGAGVFSLGFRRTSEGWRIVHDHTSSDTP
jgi:ketosteroid isomerase-like protein